MNWLGKNKNLLISSFPLPQINFYFLELGNQGWEYPATHATRQLSKRSRDGLSSPPKLGRLYFFFLYVSLSLMSFLQTLLLTAVDR